jgi:hypothetical protein
MPERLLPLALRLGEIKGALTRATSAEKIQSIKAVAWEENVSRTIAVTIAATMLTTVAVAQNRPSTTAMTANKPRVSFTREGRSCSGRVATRTTALCVTGAFVR